MGYLAPEGSTAQEMAAGGAVSRGYAASCARTPCPQRRLRTLLGSRCCRRKPKHAEPSRAPVRWTGSEARCHRTGATSTPLLSTAMVMACGPRAQFIRHRVIRIRRKLVGCGMLGSVSHLGFGRLTPFAEGFAGVGPLGHVLLSGYWGGMVVPRRGRR